MPPPPGKFRTSLSAAGTLVHNEHFADEDGRELVHVQDLTSSEVASRLSFGVARNFGLEWIQPFRVVTTRIEFEDLEGQPLVLPEGDIHHRNETLAGPADAWLLAVGGHTRGDWSFTFRGGVTAPLGRTEENPFRLGREGRPTSTSSSGTGPGIPSGAWPWAAGWEPWWPASGCWRACRCRPTSTATGAAAGTT